MSEQWRTFPLSRLEDFQGRVLGDLSAEEVESLRQWRWITDAQATADSYVKDLRDAIMARIAYDEAVAKSTARLTLVEPDPNWHDFVIPAEDPSAVLSETDASHESKESAPEAAKRPPPRRISPSPSDILANLYLLFPRSVLLPIPRGEKRPTFARWQHTTFEDTQRPAYQRGLLSAIKRGGNIGVLLGPKSGRLFALDIDDDQLVEEFLNRYPWLANTLQSRGKRGCQFWFRLEEGCEYPIARAIVPLKRNGQPFGELRLGGGKGAQSVIFGLHPEGSHYEHNGKTPIEIGLSGLRELTGWSEDQVRQAELETETSSEHIGDRILEDQALLDELTRQTGAPAYFVRRKMTALNEPFWAKLAALSRFWRMSPTKANFTNTKQAAVSMSLLAMTTFEAG